MLNDPAEYVLGLYTQAYYTQMYVRAIYTGLLHSNNYLSIFIQATLSDTSINEIEFFNHVL